MRVVRLQVVEACGEGQVNNAQHGLLLLLLLPAAAAAAAASQARTTQVHYT